ncbi:MAG: Nudix family hydrolase [Pseudomonadota bacterium]
MKSIHVLAGVLRRANGEVLVARRPAGGHLAGYWEFPGGKAEPGESRVDALIRELSEEIDITVNSARPLIRLVHRYDDRVIDLDVWLVGDWTGTPRGREGQPIDWVDLAQLSELTMPPADEPVRTALGCGSRYLITPEPGDDNDQFIATLGDVLIDQPDIQLVQLRIKTRPIADCERLLERVAEVVSGADRTLLLNGCVETARRCGFSRVHLPSQALLSMERRPGDFDLIGASCHSPAELRHAERIADFAVLSPVSTTETHPGAPPLGWDPFEAWVARCNIPVFALGGLGPKDLPTAWAHGAQGVAAIRAFWQAAS